MLESRQAGDQGQELGWDSRNHSDVPLRNGREGTEVFFGGERGATVKASQEA